MGKKAFAKAFAAIRREIDGSVRSYFAPVRAVMRELSDSVYSATRKEEPTVRAPKVFVQKKQAARAAKIRVSGRAASSPPNRR